jgi:hypothetical protein
LPAVHSTRQTDIGNQQVYPRIRVQYPQSRRAVLHLNDRITGFREDLRNKHPDRRLIIDDEDNLALAKGLGRWRRGLIIIRDYIRVVPWQVKTLVVP